MTAGGLSAGSIEALGVRTRHLHGHLPGRRPARREPRSCMSACSAVFGLELIASGGVSSLEDVRAAAGHGALRGHNRQGATTPGDIDLAGSGGGGEMITKRIIPCLDVKDGRVVKGVNFLGLRDVSSPVELAAYYSDCGADELVFYDITASAEGRKLFTDILREVAVDHLHPPDRGRRHHQPGGLRPRAQVRRGQGQRELGRHPGPGAHTRRPRGATADQCVVLSADIKRVDGQFRVFAQRRPGRHGHRGHRLGQKVRRASARARSS